MSGGWVALLSWMIFCGLIIALTYVARAGLWVWTRRVEARTNAARRAMIEARRAMIERYRRDHPLD